MILNIISKDIDFVPTYLYIKQHSITGLKYFDKTTEKDPVKYTGSGTHLSRHTKKHSRKHVVTLWYCLFYEKEELTKFSLMCSEMWDIVQSEEWANEMIEDGLNGWQTGKNNPSHNMTDEQKYNCGNAFRGKKRPEHANIVSGKNNGNYKDGKRTKEYTIKEKNRKDELRKLKNKKFLFNEIKCPHCCLSGSGPNMSRYHFKTVN